VAEGLAAIHAVGIVHRDLKPPNVMVDGAGVARLMDFGIAKRVEGGLTTTGATATGMVVGTPDYMSPEQAQTQKVDFRSDIYALGIMVYEMFTGRLPFQADTPVAIIMKHIHEPPPLSAAESGVGVTSTAGLAGVRGAVTTGAGGRPEIREGNVVGELVVEWSRLGSVFRVSCAQGDHRLTLLPR
jgi:hypothetical protein